MTAIKGLSGLMRKLDALGGNSRQAAKAGVEHAVKLVQGDAKMLCPVDDGRLRNSIQGTTTDDGTRITGVISTNVEYAPYVEFGTGPVGQASAPELPPEVAGSIHYRQTGWWIHESQISPETAEKYKFFKLETKNGTFYYTKGQPAQPFLYPAIRNNEEPIRDLIRGALKKEIDRLKGAGTSV